MRFTNRFLTTSLVAAACFVFISCSSKDSNPTNPPVSTITEAQYPAVKAQVNDFVDSTLAMFSTGFSLTATTSGTDIENALFGPDPADSTVNGNSWTTLYLSDFGASGNNIWIDSIQYRDASSQPQTIGAGAASMIVKHFWIKTNFDTTVSNDNYDVRADLNFTGIDGTVANIAGYYSMDFSSRFVSVDSTVVRDFTIVATMTNLTFNKVNNSWGSSCPISGTISVTVRHDYSKDGGTVQTSNWTFGVNFTNGTADVGVVNGSESASYSNMFCTP